MEVPHSSPNIQGTRIFLGDIGLQGGRHEKGITALQMDMKMFPVWR